MPIKGEHDADNDHRARSWPLLPQARSPTTTVEEAHTARRCKGAIPTGTASRGNIRLIISKTMSTEDFTADIASACPSERQNFRVSLISYPLDAGSRTRTI